MISFRRAAVRDTVLGAIAVAAFVAAGVYWYMNRSGQDRAPTDESSWAYFVCDNCHEFFHMNGAELDAAFSSKQMDRSKRTLGFKCPKCGQTKGVRAGKCPTHGDIVKYEPGPNDAQKCSKCNWIPG